MGLVSYKIDSMLRANKTERERIDVKYFIACMCGAIRVWSAVIITASWGLVQHGPSTQQGLPGVCACSHRGLSVLLALRAQLMDSCCGQAWVA